MNQAVPCVEILSQGDEVVSGEIVDRNGAWLSRRLVALGFLVTRHTAVGDRLKDLAAVLQEIAGRADCCLCTGGLGPTRDDLTVEAVGLAFGLSLTLDRIALSMIEERFQRRNQTMPQTNRKQALLPEGARRLDNYWGTAPGFSLKAGRCHFFFLPGVPNEMKAMFRRYVEKQLPCDFSLTPQQRIVIHLEGMGESSIEALLEDLELPPQIRLGFHAVPHEIRLKLVFPPGFEKSRQELVVAEICRRLRQAVAKVERIPIGAQRESER